MAATLVREMSMGARTSSYSDTWRLVAVGTFARERRHVRKFRVSTDDPLDTPEAVFPLAVGMGLPAEWEPHPDDPACVVLSYEWQEAQSNRERWEVTVGYGLSIDPIDEPTVVSVGTEALEQVIEEDKDQNAIVNAAGDIIEGVTQPEPITVFRVSLNRPLSGLTVAQYLDQFHDRTNTDSPFSMGVYGDYEAGTLLLADFSVEYQTRNDFEFMHWTHVIKARWKKRLTFTLGEGILGGPPVVHVDEPLGWRLRLLNAGYRYKSGAALLTFRSPDGQPLQTPGLLAADGTKLAAASPATFLTFEVKEQCEFSALGLNL